MSHLESDPVLETDRLTLRPLTGGDAPALHRISNEPAVRRYLWDDQPVLEAGIRDLIEQSTRMFSEEASASSASAGVATRNSLASAVSCVWRA